MSGTCPVKVDYGIPELPGHGLSCVLPEEHWSTGSAHHDPAEHVDWSILQGKSLAPYQCTWSKDRYAQGVTVNPEDRSVRCAVCSPVTVRAFGGAVPDA